MAASINSIDPIQKRGVTNSLAAKAPVQPACQDLQPTKDNKSTAKSWLSTQRNREFVTFVSVNVDETTIQLNLELSIRIVTSCKSSTITQQSRTACEEIQGNKSLRGHAREDKLRKIRRRTAELVIETSTITQKGEAAAQTQKAFVTIAPRLLLLQKKWKRRLGKPEPDTKGDNPKTKSTTSGSIAAASRVSLGLTSHTKTLYNAKAVTKKQRLD